MPANWAGVGSAPAAGAGSTRTISKPTEPAGTVATRVLGAPASERSA